MGNELKTWVRLRGRAPSTKEVENFMDTFGKNDLKDIFTDDSERGMYKVVAIKKYPWNNESYFSLRKWLDEYTKPEGWTPESDKLIYELAGKALAKKGFNPDKGIINDIGIALKKRFF